MADERHVITILVQALDRASAVLRKQRGEVNELEKAEKRLTPTTRALNQEQGKLAIETEKVASASEKHARTLDRSNSLILSQLRNTRSLKENVSDLRRETDAHNKSMGEQLQFFEKLESFRRRNGDFFGQRVDELPRGRSGRFIGRQSRPLGSIPGTTGAQGSLFSTEEQLNLDKLIPNFTRILNLMPRLHREADDTTQDFEDMEKAAANFFNAVSPGIQRLVREFRALGGGGGNITAGLRSFFLQQETARLRARAGQAISFEEQRRFEDQAEKVELLDRELKDLGVTLRQLQQLGHGAGIIDFGTSDRDLARLNQRLNESRAILRSQADLAGDNGPLGRLRAIFHGLGDDVRESNTRIERANQTLRRTSTESGRAARELREFERGVSRASKSLLDLTTFDDTVQVGLRRLTRFMVIIATFVPFLVSAFGTLVGAITAAVGGVTALAGAFSELAGVVATLPALFAATFGAFFAFQSVVGPGIRNITDRFKEALQVQDAARKKTTEDARAEQQQQQQIAETRVRNAEQEADLQRQISTTRRDNAEEEAGQAHELAQLKRHNAEEEQDQVRDLRRARRDAATEAAQREREYQALVKQNRADEREIAQELSFRRAQLGALRLQGADPAQIRAAEAGVTASERELAKEQTQNRTQEAKTRTANAKAARTDQEQIADAERRLHRTRRDNREQEQEAEQRLARTRRDNAEQLVQLEQQLARTRRDNAQQLQQAESQLAETRRKASGDLTDTLSQLEPAERRVVTQLIRIREEWLRLTATTRANALNFGADALSFIEQHLPAIAARANQFATQVVSLGREAFERFTRPEAISRLNTVLDDALGLTKRLGESVINVADAFLTLADAASPVSQHIGEIVESLSQRFLRSIQESQRSGGLDQFFAGTNRVLDQTLALLGHLGRALLNVLKIGAPFGEVLLGDLVEWSDRVERFTENQAPAIQSFFADSVPVVRELAGLLSDVAEQFFILGRNLIRPDAEGNVFLIEMIRAIRGGLPGFREFIEQLTRESGPELLAFVEALGRFVGGLIGPDGAFIQLLNVLTFVFNVITSLPDEIEQLGLAFFAFGGIITKVAGNLQRLLGLLSLRGGSRGGLLGGGALRNTAIGLLIAALIAFPDLLNPVEKALNGLFIVVDKVIRALDRLAQAFGLPGGSAESFAKSIIGLEIGLRILAGTSLLRVIRQLRLFIQLMRESHRVTLAGRFLDALAAVFPKMALAIEAAVKALRNYIRTLRETRRQNQLLVASNAAEAFSSMLRPIGLAIEALIRYIRQARAARTANLQLAASNAALGFSNLFGLGGFGPILGRLGRDLGGLLGRLVGGAGSLGRFGIAAGGAVIAVSQLDKALNRLFDTDFFQPIKVDTSIDKIKTGLHSLGIQAGDLLRGNWGKFWKDFNSPSDVVTGQAADRLQRTANSLGRLVRPIVRNFNGIKVSMDAASQKLLGGMQGSVSAMKEGLERFNAQVRGLMDSLETLKSSLGDFIRASIEAQPLPAQAALDRLDRQETLRDRAQRRQQANEDFQEAQRQQRRAEQSLQSAIARRARLQARLAGGGRIARTAGGREIFVQAPQLTGAQRRNIQEEIREQNRIIAQRQQELRDARQHTREVGEARLEVLRQIAVEEKREALQADLERQQAQREKEIAAAQKRADDAIGAYIKALDEGKIPLGKAQARLIAALAKIGISPEVTKAWLRTGAKAAEDFGTGFAAAVVDVTRRIRALVKDGHFNAEGTPVIVVTNANTLRKIIVTAERDPVVHGENNPAGGDRLRGAAGMRVPGGEGAAVPILAHAGEWVLNRSQQSKMAMMAGLDRSILERSLFYKLEARRPKFNFALGGVIPQPTGTTHGGTTFLTPISVQTTSPTVDAEYLSRALESRIRQVI